MITDKIKYAPEFAKADSKTFASAGVEVAGLDPQMIWRNLINISLWPRYNHAIVDIQFEDTGNSDPHLYDKAEFFYDMASENRVRCQVIYCVEPKDDRVGRLAVRGTVIDADGREINQEVTEVIVGAPDHQGVLNVEAALSYKNEAADAAEVNYGDALKEMLEKLIEYTRKHYVGHRI